MNIPLETKNEKILDFISSIEKLSNQETTQEGLTEIDSKINVYISEVLTIISMDKEGAIKPLNTAVINEISEVNWYALIFHYLFNEINNNNGQINYLMKNAIVNYQENHDFPAETEISLTDLTNIFYQSHYDIFAVSEAINIILEHLSTAITASQENN